MASYRERATAFLAVKAMEMEKGWFAQSWRRTEAKQRESWMGPVAWPEARLVDSPLRQVEREFRNRAR